MTATLPVLNSLLSAVRRLPGPVFNKELRVASRRRKSYALRFAYVGLLTAFVVGAWFSSAQGGPSNSPVYQAARMGIAGRYIAVAVVWFQFIAAQLLAVGLLGAALTDEIRKRTLPVLAVTPISGMQIVGGKLAGGLLPIVMLLAPSLPLLAIVRVFGGVSLDYVISGVCITFSATVFIGALALIPPILPRPDGRWSAFPSSWFCVLVGLFDRLVDWLGHYSLVVAVVGKPVLLLINPTDVLLGRTQGMLAARPSTGLSAWWPLHCLLLLAGSVVALWLAARRIRTIAAADGPQGVLESRAYRLAVWMGRKASRPKRSPGQRSRRTTPIRRVEGAPIVWKELHKSALERSKGRLAVYVYSSVGMLLMMMLMIVFAVVVGGSGWWPMVVGMLGGWAGGLPIGLVFGGAMAAARAIAKEREARTLPILLTTPLDDGEILRDKAIAIVRGSLPFLTACLVPLVLLLLLVRGSSVRVDWLAVLYGAGLCLVGLLGLVPFLIGLGLYCSVRLKTVAAAPACMMVLCIGLIATGCSTLIPLARRCLMDNAQIRQRVCAFTLVAALLVANAGLLFARAAVRRLRDNVF
jgi:ABC-type transport system involved in multi-copper enzyme maturation permease subunit